MNKEYQQAGRSAVRRGEPAESVQLLFGREPELQRLHDLLRTAVNGSGAAVVVVAGTGEGKTLLLDTVATSGHATGLAVHGSEAETALPYAGLHQLLWPLTERLGQLPAPQAEALRRALGDTDGEADRFLVGVATLTLLSELASERPLVITVDDAELLDVESTAVLAMVARRLAWTRIAMIFSSGPQLPSPLRGLERLPLAPLSRTAATAMLSALRPELSARQRERIVEVADGNPLALHCLRPTTDTEGGALDVGTRLSQAFARRLEAMPAQTRAQLLLLAAEPLGIGALRAVLQRMDGSEPALAPALDDELAHVDAGTVSIRSALLRTVCYQLATPAQRRAAHRALAEYFDSVPDSADRSAHHRAAAAEGPDSDVADALAASAERARSRGGHSAASRAFAAAARFSEDPFHRGSRLARAAREAWSAGDANAATALLAAAEAQIGEQAAVESDGLAGMLVFSTAASAKAAALLERDAAALGERASAQTAAVMALRARWSSGTDRGEEDDASVQFPPPSSSARQQPSAALAATVVTAWGSERRLRELMRSPSAADPAVAALLLPPAPYAVAVGLPDTATTLFHDVAEGGVNSGATTAAALTLSQIATLDIVAGRWREGGANATRALALAELAELPNVAAQAHNSLAWLAALRGERAGVEQHTQRSLAIAASSSDVALHSAAHWHLALFELLAGRPERAMHAALGMRSLTGRPHAGFAVLAAGDVLEAAVRIEDRPAAERELRRLRRWHAETGAAWAAAAVAQGRALLAEADDAEALYREAIERSEALGQPFPTARSRLLYAEWLRRRRRRNESRGHFRDALERFRALGSTPLIDRAHEGLELAGQPSRSDGSGQQGLLTAQELRVARLAAVGATNREIGAQLFISPRTVGHHLSSVFAKLGIASRTELGQQQLPSAE